MSKAKTLVKPFLIFFFVLTQRAADRLSRRTLISSTRLSQHSNLRYSSGRKVTSSPDTADCFCWNKHRLTVIGHGNVCALQVLSTGPRCFGCQEQHDLNGFHLGENIALFVYTRVERVGNCKWGPNQAWSDEKITTFQWDTELENVESKFWRACFRSGGRGRQS